MDQLFDAMMDTIYDLGSAAIELEPDSNREFLYTVLGRSMAEIQCHYNKTKKEVIHGEDCEEEVR